METSVNPVSSNRYIYDLFLSHNSKDKLLIEKVASELVYDHKIKVFYDKWHIMAGETWQETLEKALYASQDIAIFIGGNGLGPWHNEELRASIEDILNGTEDRRIIPILITGAQIEDMPRFLKRRKYIDLRDDSEWKCSITDLVKSIKRISPQKDNHTSQLKREKWKIKIEGTLPNLDGANIENIMSALRNLSGDAELSIERIIEGSVIIELNITNSAAKILDKMIKDSTIDSIAGFKILGFSPSEHLDSKYSEIKKNKSESDIKTRFIGGGGIGVSRLDNLIRRKQMLERKLLLLERELNEAKKRASNSEEKRLIKQIEELKEELLNY